MDPSPPKSLRKIRPYQDCLVVIPFLAPVALSLMVLLGFLGLWAWKSITAPGLPEEHERLIQDLRNGAYSRLEDIQPAPSRIYPAGEIHKPNPDAAYYLFFSLPESRELVIAIGADLRLIDHNVRFAD